MEASVDHILSRRLHAGQAAVKAAALVAALLLHVAVAAGVILGPGFFRQPPKRPQVLPVKLVPLRALGVEQPEPRRAEPPKPEPPKPEPPKPEPPKPEPAKPAVALPTKPNRRAKPPEPTPTPTPQPPAASGATQREGSPRGSALGVSSRLGNEAGVDNPDFTYDYYLDRMLALIEAQWTRPPIENRVVALIHFRIAKDGSLSDVELVTSSGINSFDLAGLRAVQNAAPFPPLPASYRSDSLGVNLYVH